MPRSPQEVFQHHAEALGAGDLDGIVEDYSDGDVLFLEWTATAAATKGRGRDRHVHLPGRADPAADGSVHAAAHELRTGG
jgi:hypothetical protein